MQAGILPSVTERKHMRHLVTVMTVLGAIAAGPAFANTESFTHTTASGDVPSTDNFTLTAFDAALGTLNSVEIDFSANASAQISIFNVTGSPQALTNISESIPVTVSGPAGAGFSLNVATSPFSATAIAGANNYVPATGNASSNVSVSAADFLSFENPPSGTALAFSLTSDNGNITFSPSTPGLFSSTFASSVGATTVITYRYTPNPPNGPAAVPEPMSIAILGAGLTCLGIARRRSGRNPV
jgi:hypothetical protein